MFTTSTDTQTQTPGASCCPSHPCHYQPRLATQPSSSHHLFELVDIWPRRAPESHFRRVPAYLHSVFVSTSAILRSQTFGLTVRYSERFSDANWICVMNEDAVYSGMTCTALQTIYNFNSFAFNRPATPQAYSSRQHILLDGVSPASRGGQQASKLNAMLMEKWKVTFTGHLISLFCQGLGLWCYSPCFASSETPRSLLFGSSLMPLRVFYFFVHL